MTDATHRTAADDALLEKLHARAWGEGGTIPSRGGGLPDTPFPPVTFAEVEHAEQKLGHRLPGLLRRVYTEIGDGGFGPDGGLASLIPRGVPHGHVQEWPCATAVHDRRPGWGPPASWFFLTGGGCSMEWYVSLRAVDSPVLLWDADGWIPEQGQSPHDGLRYAAPSLRGWLWTWADGGDVWDEALIQIARDVST